MPKEGKSSRPKKLKKELQPTKTALRVERAKVTVRHAGLAFNHKHQIFIAKLKRGEIWALNQLSFAAKAVITPLLEMWPPNPATPKKPAKSLAEHTADLMQMLTTEWTGLPCYLDTQYLRIGDAPSPSSAQTVFGIARAANVNAVPVTSPYFGQQFQEVIRGVIATDARGVMLRIPLIFFNDAQNIANYLSGLVAFLGVERDQVDILIDLEYFPNLVAVQQTGIYCLNCLPWIGDWRTVSLASGCFPNSISEQPMGQWIPFSRTDWNGWFGVVTARMEANLRLPSYADYGVRCGGKPEVIPNGPAPNIRYTDTEIIWVRRAPKAPNSMRSICQSLTNQPYFRGAQFSRGDADIAQKAATTDPKNGSPEQWIQWCTNHQLELTFSQIQNLP